MRTMWQAGVGAIVILLATSAAAPAVDKEDIAKGVERGVLVLRKNQKSDGSWENGQNLGMTALAALALLECNVETDDPAIKLAAKYVREASIRDTGTYSVALSIIFLDRLGDPVDIALIESLSVRLLAAQLRSGAWTYACPAPSQAEMERLSKQVKDAPELKGRRTLPKPGENKRTIKDLAPEIQEQLQFLGKQPSDVPPSMMGDRSNTQFATLALWIARRHGLPVEPALARVEGQLRTGQNRDGGWSYEVSTRNDPSTATMTAAGVLCLSIVDGTVNDIKRAQDPKAVGLDAKTDKNLGAALKVLAAIIDHPVSVKRERGMPAQIPQVGGKTFYFLWTLERVGVALDLDTIGGKDWFNWGAEILLANQQNDGSWKGEYGGADTCFALLFLRRANLASDLTTSLKGKLADPGETTLKAGPDGLKGTIRPPLEEKSDKNPNREPAKKIDESTEQGKIAKEIVQASGKTQERLIEKYREEKGVKYTEALATAIPHLSGEPREKARDALAERLARMKADTLTNYLKDDEPEIRRAAALACALKESKSHIPPLIEMLRDKDSDVARAALMALKDLTSQNFGPAANATAAERDKAVAAWQEWWKKQSK